MVTNIKLNDGKYIATFEICDNNEDYSICNLGQKLTNDVIQVNKTFIDIDIYKSQMEEKDQRIAELEQDLEFTTKTANELIEIKHKLEQELAELKEKAIVPKFKGSSIVYSIAFKEIEKVQVIAYLNRCIILCRNLKTRELHTIHCDYLFETEQEAQTKLKEMKGNE